MKIDHKKFSTALSEVAGLTNNKTTLPVLNCVHLVAANGTLEISASNLDCWKKTRVECDGDLLPICVPAKTLEIVLKSFSGETEVSVLPKEKLSLKGNSSATISGIAGEEFPLFPKLKTKAIGINTTDLATGIESVYWACAKEGENRKNLEAVSVKATDNKIECLALDGRYLAKWDSASIAAPCAFLLPSLFAPSFCDALRKPTCKLSVGENFVMCEHDSGIFTAKLAEYNFPKCDQIINQDKTKLGELVKSGLVSILGTCASIGGSQTFAATDLEFSETGIAVEIATAENNFKSTCAGKFKKATGRMDAMRFALALKSVPADSLELFSFDAGLSMMGGNTFVMVMGIAGKK